MTEGKRLTIWIPADHLILLDFMKGQYKIAQSKIFGLALLNMVEKIEDNNIYKKVNLKEYGQTLERRELRRMQSLIRAEQTSKALFMKRVYLKVRTYILNGASTIEVVNLLKLFRKEALHYENSTDLIKNLDIMIEKGVDDIKKLNEHKEFLLKNGEVKKTITKNETGTKK